MHSADDDTKDMDQQQMDEHRMAAAAARSGAGRGREERQQDERDGPGGYRARTAEEAQNNRKNQDRPSCVAGLSRKQARRTENEVENRHRALL